MWCPFAREDPAEATQGDSPVSVSWYERATIVVGDYSRITLSWYLQTPDTALDPRRTSCPLSLPVG